MGIAATEPWQQPSSWRQEIRLRRRKRMLLSMERPCGLDLLRGSRRKENSKIRLPLTINGQNKWRLDRFPDVR